MTYHRFEDLPVWRDAIEFAVQAYSLVEDRAYSGQGDLRNQLQRASLSISNNIAEGFERGTTAELLMFIYIARGSAGEARSQLHFSQQLGALQHLRERTSPLIAKAEAISRQLRGWADSLQNSDIDGQRHLNEISRAEYRQARGAEAFMRKLEEIRRKAAKADPEE